MLLIRAWWAIPLFIAFAFVLHMQAGGSEITWAQRLALMSLTTPQGFLETQFVFAELPRALLAILSGAALGITGSLVQQLTQNPLASPLTLGTSAGAWLALVIGAVLAPQWVADHGVWVSMAGALLSTGLVLGIAGLRQLENLSVIIAGMAVSIALGSLATLIVLLNEGFVDSWFIWGSGDLTQVDWRWVQWLAWPTVIGIGSILLLHRPLTLLRLGSGQASARGLALVPFMLVGLLLAIGLTASTITAVGVIGFVALLVPHIARMFGARTPLQELTLSTGLGALLLLLTDSVALWASQHSTDMVPSGASAALIGAPGLIWLLLKGLPPRVVPATSGLAPARHRPKLIASLCGLVMSTFLISLSVAPSATGWQWSWPSELQWSFRLPRTVGAIAAGAGMALSGLVLQRLLRNPLVSPDIVGVSSGATLALVGAFVFFELPLGRVGAPIALLGGLSAMLLLMVFGWRQHQRSGALVLVGLSLTAITEALVQFALAAGGQDSYRIMSWLAGSTYRIDSVDAFSLAAIVLALVVTILQLQRWLSVLELGDAAAQARGLSAAYARTVLLLLAASVAALVTALIGPVAFIGMVAPHMARLLGARTLRQQMSASVLIGALFFLTADWLARVVLYPTQLPAGAFCAVLGGLYLAALVTRQRRQTL